ncbi:site-specific DNA-methyltransferase, partial [Geobacillus stearothermophilus]|uniref:site-specific DNA-methyltransferase n=1 Tax=Geobacillus stearothermophilus TaxID=1422 RepID=UPI003D240530
MEKLDGKSMDIVKANIEALKQLFPDVVTEGKIDFEKLKLILGEEIEARNEKYEFTWHGKTQAMKLAQTPSTGTLRPDKASSKNWDTTENLYIEGDNLEVLKLLQKSYFGKIKMIYIDPPYNTGKDFVYKDDFRDNIKNYKEITQQTTKANTETSGRYHTDWLNMMYPRLKLARNLLTDDGVIFISIDDTEVANLRKILDEIFGENNFIASITRNTNSSKNQSLFVSVSHDYCLIYARDISVLSTKHAENKWSVPKNNIEEYKRKIEELKNLGLSNEQITGSSPKV